MNRMKSWGRWVPLLLLFPLLSGCGLGYKLKAKAWGEILQNEVDAKIKNVSDTMKQRKSAAFTDAAIKNQLLTTLEEVENTLLDLQLEIPEDGPSHHKNLIDGVQLLLESVEAAQSGLKYGNREKIDEFQEKAGRAGSKLKRWGDAVRG